MNLISKFSKILPGFRKKPGKPKYQPAPVLTVAVPDSKPAAISQPAPPQSTVAPTKPEKMLDDVCAFLARYLHCSPHQRTVLALWVLHTWCFSAARSTPYLAIQSSRKLSGKTRCLRLLSLLCSHSALTSGYTPSALVKRIHSRPDQLPTFLLDESPATLGSRSRSKNPKLRAILVSGFQPGIGYSGDSSECAIFSPKAFAFTGSLPDALADCSIPIVLSPLNTRVAQPPSAVSSEKNHVVQVPLSANDQIERFDLATAQQEVRPLLAGLESWSKKNLPALKSVPVYKRKDFPERLSSRGQDMVEPLLQLADAVGGDYPARARQALLAVFDDLEKQQRAIGLELLRDIRNIFQRYDWPEGLPTAVLVSELQSLPARPWDADGCITDRTLPKMLRPFEIYPRMIRFKESGNKGSGKTLRGYSQKEFVTVWHNLLDQTEISNKDAGCYTVTHTGTTAKKPESAPQETRVAQPPPAVSSLSSAATAATASANSDAAGLRAASAATEPKKSQSEGRLASGFERSDTNIDPRIKGILQDPRNYFRQYPEQAKNNLRDIAVKSHHWPQPADDKGTANVIYTLEDGVKIPYTIVNRNPDDPENRYGYRHRDERWPVLLSDQEKAQVATARFFELHAAALAQRQKKQNEAAHDQQKISSAISRSFCQ